jgi:subtilisin family serine protease
MNRLARSSFLAVPFFLLFSACSDDAADPVAPSSPPQSAEQLAPVYLAPENGVPDSYIVVLREDGDGEETARSAGVSLRTVYDDALKGFAAELTAPALQFLRQRPEVAYIEQDRVVTVEGTQDLSSSGHTWGIDRIDQRNLPLSKSYRYRYTGSGVNAYVIDSGLQANHPDFGGRAKNVYDAWGGSGNDCRGHGTHVAGILGGKKYGVAKQARLYGVRVLNCNGSGWLSGILSGIDWVRKNRRNPAVANLSLGTSYSPALNDAVNRLAASGVFVAVAAGNSGRDACNYSPASAKQAFTTAASDKYDYAQSWSNRGSCVSGFAPGRSIRSDFLNGGSATYSGTSMASPHVAGIAALYKQKYGNASSSTIRTWIRNKSTTGALRGSLYGSPNRLVYNYGL